MSFYFPQAVADTDATISPSKPLSRKRSHLASNSQESGELTYYILIYHFLLSVFIIVPESNIPEDLKVMFESFSKYFYPKILPEGYFDWYTELCQKRDGVAKGSDTCTPVNFFILT